MQGNALWLQGCPGHDPCPDTCSLAVGASNATAEGGLILYLDSIEMRKCSPSVSPIGRCCQTLRQATTHPPAAGDLPPAHLPLPDWLQGLPEWSVAPGRPLDCSCALLEASHLQSSRRVIKCERHKRVGTPGLTIGRQGRQEHAKHIVKSWYEQSGGTAAPATSCTAHLQSARCMLQSAQVTHSTCLF